MNYFASNLKFLRKSQKISQSKLAEDLKVNRSNIAAYESKNVEPRLKVLIKIANYFNVGINELLLVDFKKEKESQDIQTEILKGFKEKVKNYENKPSMIAFELVNLQESINTNQYYKGKVLKSILKVLNDVVDKSFS